MTTTPDPILVSLPGSSTFQVTVPTTAAYAVNFSQTFDASAPITTVQPGSTATFGAPGLFFASSPGGTSTFTYISYSSKLFVQTAAGTALTAVTAETQMAGFTIPANVLQLGNTLTIRWQGIQTAVNSTDTLAINVRIGAVTLTGTLLVTGAAVNGANGQIFEGEVRLYVRAAPSAASAVVADGWYMNLAAINAGTWRSTFLASTNLATNAPLVVEVTGTLSTNNAGNSARIDIFEVTIS